jgi:hypothetical protein
VFLAVHDPVMSNAHDEQILVTVPLGITLAGIVPGTVATPVSVSTIGAEHPCKTHTFPERANSFLRVRSV